MALRSIGFYRWRQPSNILETLRLISFQRRLFNVTPNLNSHQVEKSIKEKSDVHSSRSVLDEAPRAYGKATETFTPKPLNRPIGLAEAPRSGENTGIDSRTLKQRRDDFVDYDKHIAKRKLLTQKISAPYFREWTNMRHHKGKSFLAPLRLFKEDHALFFPNFYGQTLLEDKVARNTTPVLEGKVSIVCVFSSAWALKQTETFTSKHDDAGLHKILEESRGIAQIVQINVEDNTLKAAIVRFFMPGLRKKLDVANWGRYFLVRNSLSRELKDSIGLLNSKVGYVYVLDRKVKIRWAASGICEGQEKDSLVRGVQRLIDEVKHDHREQ